MLEYISLVRNSVKNSCKMMESNRVFIGNITHRVGKNELQMDFEKYGRVLEVFIGKGFGFITFDEPRSAMRAVEVSVGIFHNFMII